jgi:hypothetical protein
MTGASVVGNPDAPTGGVLSPALSRTRRSGIVGITASKVFSKPSGGAPAGHAGSAT